MQHSVQYGYNCSLSEANWAEISAVSATNDAANVWSVGDTKVMPSKSTSSNAVLFEIIDFNKDKLSTGGVAGITFGTKYIPSIKGAFKMNNGTTNEGGYPDSQGFHTINDEVYNVVFPDEVKAVMKTVQKECYVNRQLETISCRVFLFSASEVNYPDDYFPTNEGTAYAAFTGNEARAKQMATGNPPSPTGQYCDWWLRTRSFVDDGTFCYVNSSGAIGNENANISKYMCFGFCV